MKKQSKTKILKVKELKLFDFNPRYTDFLTIKWEEIRKNGNYKNQDEIALDLLKYEEDFSEFKTLLKSLFENGYQNDQDKLICLETNNNDYIVLEGNRRILASKMITNIDWANMIFKRLKNLISDELLDFANGDEIYSEEEIVNRKKTVESMIQWFKRNIIPTNLEESYIDSFTRIEVSFFDKEIPLNDETISIINRAIFGRSVSAPGGKKRWPRYQTLKNSFDIFNRFFNETNNIENSLDKASLFLFRSKTSFRQELLNAQFIMFLKDNYSGKLRLDNWKMLRTSAIELSIDVIDISYITTFPNFKSFLNIKNNIGKEITFDETVIDKKNLSNFLIDKYLEGFYTTRGWKRNKTKKPLYEILGEPWTSESFGEMREDGKFEVNNIHNIANDLLKLSNRMPKVEYVTPSDSSEHILKVFMSREMKNEVQKLLHDFDNQTAYTYPYFSLASLARTAMELFAIYIFSSSEKIRKEFSILLINAKGRDEIKRNRNKSKQPYFSLFAKFTDNEYELKGGDQIFKELFTSNFETDNLYSEMRRTMKFDNPTEILFPVLNNDSLFSSKKDFYYEMFENYKNQLFNRTVHAPYWLNTDGNLGRIEKIMSSSMQVISNFCSILDINVEEYGDDTLDS